MLSDITARNTKGGDVIASSSSIMQYAHDYRSVRIVLVTIALMGTFYVISSLSTSLQSRATSQENVSVLSSDKTTAPKEALIKSNHNVSVSSSNDTPANQAATKQSDSSTDNSSNTNVTVNGKTTKLRGNGSFHKEIHTNGNSTTFDVAIKSKGNATTDNSSTIDISVESSSETITGD